MMDFDERYRVDVLLREYDTLRAEVLQRVQTRWGIVGFIGVIAGLVLEKTDTGIEQLLLIAGSIGLAVFVWFKQEWGIRRCASYLVRIEERVNTAVGPLEADKDDEDPRNRRILSWEQDQSVTALLSSALSSR